MIPFLHGTLDPGVVPTAFESIATVTGTGSSSSITFTSIPQTYTSLQIRGIARGLTAGTTASNLRLIINADTGANYAYHNLQGTGATAVATGGTALGYVLLPRLTCNSGVTSDTYGAMIIDLHDYASTTRNKTVRVFGGLDANTASTEFRVSLASGLWINTSAITSIEITSDAGNFTTASTFALYGIKGA